jgi:c(7)-type cytochrome triheme protein
MPSALSRAFRAAGRKVAGPIPSVSAAVAALALLVTCAAPERGARPAGGESTPAAAPEASSRRITALDGRSWMRLSEDGLHDPANDSIDWLQQPAEALSELPPDTGSGSGNRVDWMEALRSGAIQPRTNIHPETKVRVLDLDIVLSDTAGQPHVVFPHRQHTEWLDCSNCHPGIFVAKRGANDFGMLDVLQGEYCGRCHGAVSFPLTECKRCHSRDKPNGSAN